MTTKKKTIAAGVDLGGTTFKVGLITRGGEIIASQEYDTPRSNSRPLALDAIAAAIPGLMESATVKPEQISGVGLGIPGPVDPDAGVIKQCPNLHELDGVEAGARLASALELPVFVGNDAYCATLAELRYGAGRDIVNLVMLTLGTGVGGGIALDNQVRRGPRQIMGEVGHIVVQPGGPRCGCGNHGCLEAIVGRDGIVERAVRLLETGRVSSLDSVAGALHEDLTPKTISEAAGDGDALALEVMGATGYFIGLALCSCVVLADPDLIVIGGGIAAAGDVLLGPIRRTVRHCSMISDFDTTKIVAAELADEAGMYGAAALAWERLADGRPTV